MLLVFRGALPYLRVPLCFVTGPLLALFCFAALLFSWLHFSSKRLQPCLRFVALGNIFSPPSKSLPHPFFCGREHTVSDELNKLHLLKVFLGRAKKGHKETTSSSSCPSRQRTTHHRTYTYDDTSCSATALHHKWARRNSSTGANACGSTAKTVRQLLVHRDTALEA